MYENARNAKLTAGSGGAAREGKKISPDLKRKKKGRLSDKIISTGKNTDKTIVKCECK